MKDRLLLGLLLVLIVAVCGLMTYGVEYPAKAVWRRHRIRRRLGNLTEDEQAGLQGYLLEQTAALTWGRVGLADEVLRRDGILHLLASDVGPSTRAVPMDSLRIDPIARKYLHAHPDLVDLERTKAGSPFSPIDWTARWKDIRGKKE